MQRSVDIYYYAILREQAGLGKETFVTHTATVSELYNELRQKYDFTLSGDLLKAAVNNEFVQLDTEINSGDRIAFIPPVAGG